MSPRLWVVLRFWWVWIAPVGIVLGFVGSYMQQAAVIAGVGTALAGILWPRHAPMMARLAAMLLCSSLAALAVLLATDQFDTHYVWLYSQSRLPLAYKIANLWGGDEGTLLTLAALLAAGAPRLVACGRAAGTGALALVAMLAVGAALWSPFTGLPDVLNNSDSADGQGMNVHLVSPWMLIHPPLLFAAYACFLLPVGAAVAALLGQQTPWGALAARGTRIGWQILSASLVAGMWWAYEDFTFGQFWHWDPVQTSVFAVWALSTAHIHTLRRYRADGAYALLHPLLGLATATAALGSLAITRNPALASSHRYVGDTSFPWLAIMAIGLTGVTVAAFVIAKRSGPARRPERGTETEWLIRIATLALIGCALVAVVGLAEAYMGAALAWPRPEKFTPFFEFLARWTSSAEAEHLRALFDQWDVDRYRMNAFLVPIAIVIGIAGGHNFMPAPRHVRWLVTVSVALAAITISWLWQPMASAYSGAGMTSAHTTAIFPGVEMALIAMAYLGVAALAWGVGAVSRRGGTKGGGLYYRLPVGLLHTGVVVALAAATMASVYDRQTFRNVNYPNGFDRPIVFPWGYEVDLAINRDGLMRDGIRATNGGPGFYAVANVNWRLVRDGTVIDGSEGEAVYRDVAPPLPGGAGPVRLMCEIVDYRYARTVSGATRLIDPFIHRGLLRDVQIWLPAVEYGLEPSGDAETLLRRPSIVPVVLKIYPMMTWMWLGLALTLISSLALSLWEARGRPLSDADLPPA